MAEIFVKTREGGVLRLHAEAGSSVMEIIRDGGVDELLALCGGNCSCATCHIYVDPQDAERVPPVSEDESDLLEGSTHRTELSRLSCQIRFQDALGGIHVTIAPED